MPDITITLSKDGLKVEANGYKSTNCIAPITAVVSALGANIGDLEPKEELFQNTGQDNVETQTV